MLKASTNWKLVAYGYVDYDYDYADLVRTAFPSETVGQIGANIRQNLNNADKLFKRKVAVRQESDSY